MSSEFAELRACLYRTKEELVRFRRIVVKSVMSTEIFDPALAKLRMDRWEKAFGEDDEKKELSDDEIASRKANAAGCTKHEQRLAFFQVAAISQCMDGRAISQDHR